MGQVFAPEKPLKEVVRENQRLIKKGIRDLEREIRTLETNLKKLEIEIKKMAKQNQMGSVKVMAKDYVRTKQHITRFIEMKTHLNAVSLKMQTVKSHQAMSDAMKGVTVALGKMNKKMNMPQLTKIMQEFMKENERSELTQEMMGDAIDDAMGSDETAEEEDRLVNQILDEIGIGSMGDLNAAPSSNLAQANPAAQKVEENAMSDLEARLNSLRN